jgi:Ca-activated chloride channel family protein
MRDRAARLVVSLVPLLVAALPATASAQAFLDARPAAGDAAASPLPLVEERLEVRIDRQFASSTLSQTFVSRADERLEGRYALMLGEGARVSGFAYWNGERKIVGEVFEKEVAAQVYGEVSGLDRDPGLFEQVGEGAFTFRVFPIEPRERKKVEVRFGRYLARTGDTFEYRLALGADVHAAVDVTITDDREILGVESPTHRLTVERQAGAVRVTAVGGGDFVLRVRVQDEALTPRVRVHRDAGQDAYVLVTMGAPDDADARVVPKDVTIVIDHSGSMDGEPMTQALAAADAVLARLSEHDRVNVIIFDDGVDQLYDVPRAVTDEVRAEARRYVAKVTSDGGTDIALALGRALAAQRHDDRPDVILFMTDGQSDAQAALKVARDDAGDARVFTIGIGSGVEKPLLSRLAAEKRGRFTFIPDASALEAGVVRVFEQVDHPVMLDVAVRGAQRSYPRTLPDLARGEELVVVARLRGDGPITVSGTVGGRRVERVVDVTLPASEARPWVGRQWAGARVDDLLQEIALRGANEELQGEAIELALAYNLVTPYTSFLAIPEEELTDAAASTLADARARKRAIRQAHKDAAALSRDDMPPGDPVLSVRAPRDAQQVTAYFPFGLVKDLAWDANAEVWTVRFLVPKDVPDGLYAAKVVIVRADGSVELAEARYRIDSLAPDFEVEIIDAPGGVMLRVSTQGGVGVVTVALASNPRVRLTLVRGADGTTFEGYLALPEGAHQLRVVAADTARNEADTVVAVEVR